METALSKTLDETYESALGNPSLRDFEEGGMNSRPVDLNFFPVLQAIVAPDTFLQSILDFIDFI